jgi:hypothetical protein
MANLLETAYGTLSSLFSGNGNQTALDVSTLKNTHQEPELLRASSPAEMADKALEYQQTGFLNNQFLQIAGSERDKKLSYEPNRRAQYLDYVAMESYPIIRTALDVLAEEATTTGEDGKVLKIYSSNKRVKQVLENLFYNVLDVNTVLHSWARNLCKYGDNFIYLLLDPDHGVQGFKQLSAIDIERKEEIKNNKIQVTFKHQNLNGRSDEYNIWQMAHFRLLSDERRMPYGMSVLDAVRRTWKMLTMCEDAMMVYRITRAGERRIFKVFVGNAKDEQEVKQIMQAVIRQQKSSRLTDPMTGDMNWKYNVASNDQDIYIPVRSENAANPIETLQGASNLDAISDISYLRDNLFTGLGIPKSFLAFSEDGGGEGKALSMLDIRFARKVNRIQQALISELNKIAIIHLALLGGDYLEHLNNFDLTLNNPSTQSELLKLEVYKGRLEAYQMAVTPSDKGIAPMSESLAARTFLNMSDEERMDDLMEQFVETKVGDEIKSSGQLLKSSQMYDKIIKFKNAGFGMDPTSSGDTADGGMGDMSGGMGGGDLGGGDLGGAPDMNGPAGGDLGGGGDAGGNAPGAAPMTEGRDPFAGPPPLPENATGHYRAFLIREAQRKARANRPAIRRGPSPAQVQEFAQEIQRRKQEEGKIHSLSEANLRNQADLDKLVGSLRK